jgi:serine/threonine protein kinase
MEPERWRQVERLYHAALERATEERAAFLDGACADDEALRREIESLLAFDDRAELFIETPPDDIAAEMIALEHSRSMAGRTLGHYRIDSLLGAGGMGEVYRARDTRLSREVAIKILPEELSDNPDALRRFEREARAVAALSHPNILAIHDFGNEQGLSYAVMELLEGETIRARLARGALPWREAAEIGLAIADGVAAAHAKGIIHRDLKPENVFLTSDGQVKILDFGIARVKRIIAPDAETLTSSPTKSTEAGSVMGTIGYMSPEQVRGETADAPSDIFSLGCVLYEMVSGRRPFIGETGAETMAAILRDAPPPIARSGHAASAEMERVALHCLEKQPGERYQSAPDLASDLRALLGGNKGALSLPPRRLRPAAPVIAVVLILLLGVAVFLYWAGGREKGVVSLAIMPLVTAGGNSEAEYLSDGITESLINSLSQLPQLRVMARSAVFNYKPINSISKVATTGIIGAAEISGKALSTSKKRLPWTRVSRSLTSGWPTLTMGCRDNISLLKRPCRESVRRPGKPWTLMRRLPKLMSRWLLPGPSTTGNGRMGKENSGEPLS